MALYMSYMSLSRLPELKGLPEEEQIKRKRVGIAFIKKNHPLLAHAPVWLSVGGAFLGLYIASKAKAAIVGDRATPLTHPDSLLIMLAGCASFGIGMSIGGWIGLQIVAGKLRLALRQLFN
jgi:hypothetical protein